MSKSRIKGITVEIGGDVTGLDKALSGVNKEIRETSSELRDVERLLKLDPQNTELLRQQYELLSRQIDQTEKKLDALREAEKDVQQQMQQGKVSEDQYNALKREIIATESSLRDLKGRAGDAERALNGIDEKPVEDVERAADDARDALKKIDEKQVKEVERAADSASDALEDAGKSASNFGDYLKANAVTEGAKALVSAVKDLATETKEYSKIMGTLETSSEKAGYSAEQTNVIYERLYQVLGDEQTAATTTANLQAIGLSQKDLITITRQTIGAWAQYGDSIPIDGLAESINETIKAGQVTGTFADVLNWAGTSEDEFNAKLEEAGSAAERANLVMQEMSNQGLQQASDEWVKNNEALVENNQAQAELQEQMAELGEKVLPILTDITSMVSGMLTWFNNLDPQMQSFIAVVVLLIAAIGPATVAIQGMQAAIAAVSANPAILATAGIIAAVVLLVAAIAAYGDEIQAYLQKLDDFLQNIFAKDWKEVFGPIIGEALNMFFANVKNIWDSVKLILDGIIDFIRGVFTGDWERAWNGIVQIFAGIFKGLEASAKAPINAVIGLVNGAISGINGLINGINKLPGVDIPTLGKIPYLAKGGVLLSGSAIVGEAGPEILTMSGNRAVVQPLTNQYTSNTSMGGVVLNIYGAPGQDVRELADIIENELAGRIERREAAYR